MMLKQIFQWQIKFLLVFLFLQGSWGATIDLSQRRYENFYEILKEKKIARSRVKSAMKAHKKRRKELLKKRDQAILERRRQRKSEIKKRTSDRQWKKAQKEKAALKERQRREYLKERAKKKRSRYQIPPMKELGL